MISNAIAVNSDFTAASLATLIFSNARLASFNLSMNGARRLSQTAGFSTGSAERGVSMVLEKGGQPGTLRFRAVVKTSGDVGVLTANVGVFLRSPLRQPNMRRNMEHKSYEKMGSINTQLIGTSVVRTKSSRGRTYPDNPSPPNQRSGPSRSPSSSNHTSRRGPCSLARSSTHQPPISLRSRHTCP